MNHYNEFESKEFEADCIDMIERQLKARNIESLAVLDAMRNVPRHMFLPDNLKRYAYDDAPVPIGWGQTISQPYMVAYMTEQLKPVPGMKILEIGTGSGYQAAILAYLGCYVYTIELVNELAAMAITTLSELNIENVKVKHGDGYMGWPEEAPFDAIIVTAAPESLPKNLVGQISEGGEMIIPIGQVHSVQSLKRVEKRDGRVMVNDLLQVRFVPMLGAAAPR